MIEARLGHAALLSLMLSACAPTGPFYEPAAPLPDAEASMAEGRLLLRSGEYDLAYSAFITALRTGNNPAEALTGAGLALEAQGLLTRAREHFERAAEIAPGSDVAHNNLGVVHYRLGDYARARLSFRTAFAVSSGQSAIAAANLRAAERALAARSAPVETGSGYSLQRVGSSEYRLLAPSEVEAPPAAVVSGTGTAAVPTAEDVPADAPDTPDTPAESAAAPPAAEPRPDPHPPLTAAAPAADPPTAADGANADAGDTDTPPDSTAGSDAG